MSEAVAAEGEFAWGPYTERLNELVTASRVNDRRALFTADLMPQIAAHPLSDKELVGLVRTLTLTVSRYVDRESRSLVLAALRELSVKKASVFVEVIAGVLGPIVASAQPKTSDSPDMVGATPAAKFVLLTWINLALPVP
ncbi:hypothetical protein EC988_009080, partial [Linderina pennispora]